MKAVVSGRDFHGFLVVITGQGQILSNNGLHRSSSLLGQTGIKRTEAEQRRALLQGAPASFRGEAQSESRHQSARKVGRKSDDKPSEERRGAPLNGLGILPRTIEHRGKSAPATTFALSE